MLDDAVFNDRFKKLANQVWNARKGSTDIVVFAREHFDLSESGFRNWLRGTNATKDFLLIEALGRLAGMNLEETKAYFYGESELPKGESLGESKLLLFIAAAAPIDLAKYLQALADRFSEVVAKPQTKTMADQPINSVAAEFARSIQAALVEHGMTIEEMAAKCGVELPCLLLLSVGQKVPSYRAVVALTGMLKDVNGQVYSGEAMFDLLKQDQAQTPTTPTKKPPQTKRLKRTHDAN